MTEYVTHTKSDDFLNVSRDKWREVPAGSELLGRVFSSELLKLSDEDLLAAWRRLDSDRSNDHRVWYRILYREFFAGKRVLELGSGLGFDALHFAKLGAKWTCADIVRDNLEFIRRIAATEGMSDRVDTLWLEGAHSLEPLAEGFDVIWANGSLHHAPFEIARAESLIALKKLKPAGRWIELYYPYDRWLREGSTDFSEWGKKTDGERTPWAEWHDVEKIRRRLFPARTTTILDFELGGGSYGWADLCIDDPGSAAIGASELERMMRSVDILPSPIRQQNGKIRATRRGIEFTTVPNLWAYNGILDISQAVSDLGASAIPKLCYAVDLVLRVDVGSVGLVLTGEDPNDFKARELFVDARPAEHRITISTFASAPPTHLLLRNAADGVRTSGIVLDARVRFGS